MPTRHIPKCSEAGCNQQRTLASPLCGKHVREAEERLADEQAREDFRARLDAARSFDDLKELLLEVAEHVGL